MAAKIRYLLLSILLLSCAHIKASEEWTPYYITVTVTAYCPCSICCRGYDDGKTATGRSAYTPGVAVDPSVIPLGARLDIPGYPRTPKGAWVRADDVGGAIKGLHIDVRLKTHDAAVKWGVRRLRVRVWTKKVLWSRPIPSPKPRREPLLPPRILTYTYSPNVLLLAL